MKRIIFLLLSMLSNMTYSEIIYSDINPDSTVSGNLQNPWANYLLDLNNDGSPDFVITHFFPEQNLYYVEMTGYQNKNCEIIVDEQSTPSALDLGNNIDNLQTGWYDTKTTAIHMRRFWVGAKDKYLGLRTMVNNKWIYGWARLDIATDESSFTIKDYAYESTPDSGLTAGEVLSSAGYLLKSENGYSIYPNPASDYIEITVSRWRGKGMDIRIFDILGSILLSVEQTSPSVQRIDVSHLPPGVYFVRVGNNLQKFIKL